MTVAVLTDSAASLPPELADAAGITVVPLTLIVGDDTYDDGQMPLADLLARPAGDVSTSGPTPGRLTVALQAALDAADHAVVLTISQAMSSTFDAARLAARPFGERVRVLDTETAAGAQGLVALAAAHRAAEPGATVDEVETAGRQAVGRVRLAATVPNLDRLVASGRVPGMAGWAGSRLGVNPLFEFRSGRVRPLRPAFSRESALSRILSALRDSDGTEARLHLAALHAEAADDAGCLLQEARAVTEPATAFVGTFSPAMVTHTGAGLVGLAWWWEPN